MSEFQRRLHAAEAEYAAKEHFRQQVEDAVFESHRNILLSLYCQRIRLLRRIAERNRLFPDVPSIDGGSPSSAYCNAAAHILSVTPEPIQRFFLATDLTTKDRLVAAVMEDGGIVCQTGYFSELPTC